MREIVRKGNLPRGDSETKFMGGSFAKNCSQNRCLLFTRGIPGRCPGSFYVYEYQPFEPYDIPLGHFLVAPVPPRPQDGAARWPWSGLRGHSPTKAVQRISTDHLSHLAAL